MENKMIYLDQNVFSKIINKENGYIDLNSQIYRLSNAGYIFPYSPAHIEEIHIGPTEKHSKFLELISKISKDVEILPDYDDKPTKIKEENPKICFERVKKYDTRGFIQETSQMSAAFKNEKQYEKYFKIPPTSDRDYGALVSTRQQRSKTFNLDCIHSLSAKEFIYHPYIIEQLALFNKRRDDSKNINSPDKLLNLPISVALREVIISKKQYFSNCIKPTYKKLDLSIQFDSFKNNHSDIELYIQEIFHFFNRIGFHPEKTKKANSAVYDVTHAIYATKANYLVTDDEKFYKKVHMAYEIFGVPTKVIKSIDLKNISLSE